MNYSRAFFYISIVLFLFLFSFSVGFAVQRYKIWPYEIITTTKDYVESFIDTGHFGPSRRFFKARTQSADRVEVVDPDRVMDGFLITTGWDESTQTHVAWLTDREGSDLHRWVIDYDLLDPDGPANGSKFPHGVEPLADGSLIVNFDKGDVMARIDSCGRPLWIKQGYFHHNMGKAEDGSLWTWEGVGTAYSQEQYLVNFDPATGDSLARIALIDDIIAKMGPRAVIFGVRPDFEFISMSKDPANEWKQDIFHPNDIEVLHSDMADSFPGLQAGDLLISLRNLHLVAVIDPVSYEVKWWSHGPWTFQHDPDFTSDGKISVYDNARFRGRSEIIKIDPVTRDVTNELFHGELNFFSQTMGVHQYLPNGNVLIVVPEEGRVIETSANGDLLFEYNNRASESFNAGLDNAIWLPPSFFESLPRC